MKEAIEKSLFAIDRPGLFLISDELSKAMSFFSGMNYICDGLLLEGFEDWLVQKYYDDPQPFAWEVLVQQLPICNSGDSSERVLNFLSLLKVFLQESNGLSPT